MKNFNEIPDTISSVVNKEKNETIFENIITEKEKIYFEFNSYNIDMASKSILEKFAKDMLSNPMIKLKLTGHTDSSGPADFNLKLSLQRAQKVKEYLIIQYKIPPERIKTIGLGETQLAFPENTMANRAKNRRVEVEVYVDEN
jgi:outer membrane protein OmpA-like peptidoglycan-associated protein